jgi:hypothetical protein
VTRPLVIVDGANVVGSVPDGWWRDRLGAARRLREALTTVPAAGLPGVPGPVEVILVVEGAARGLAEEVGDVPVSAASGEGDDAIVSTADRACAAGRRCIVVTSDRGLRERVRAVGAEVAGPRSLPYRKAGERPTDRDQ